MLMPSNALLAEAVPLPCSPLAKAIVWVLRPLFESWIIFLIYSYTALNMTLYIDCYGVGAVPKLLSRIPHNPHSEHQGSYVSHTLRAFCSFSTDPKP